MSKADDDRATLIDAVAQHNASIARGERDLDKLVQARARCFKKLNLEHGMSYREIGDIAGMSHGAVLRALRKVGVEVGTSTTKPGPKPHVDE